MVFGARIKVKYALRRVDMVRLDTLRAVYLDCVLSCDFHNIWLLE